MEAHYQPLILRSINDAIEKCLCLLTYVSVPDVAKTAVALGKWSLIANIDIKAAYRLVPLRPRIGGGLEWDGRTKSTCPRVGDYEGRI